MCAGLVSAGDSSTNRRDGRQRRSALRSVVVCVSASMSIDSTAAARGSKEGTQSPMQANPSDVLLDLLFERYKRTGRAVPVNFRKLVNIGPYPERSTHLLHSYPAKLLAHIPYLFVRSRALSGAGGVILDPFCGSGTVLLEAVLAGKRAIGTDVNPAACLISRAKTQSLCQSRIRTSLRRLRAGYIRRTSEDVAIPDVVNIHRWYYPHVIRQLAALRAAIDAVRSHEIRQLFYCCFSECARRVSLADPRLSVPVRLRADQYKKGHPLRSPTETRLRRLRRTNVWAEFARIVEQNVVRLESLAVLDEAAKASVLNCSASEMVSGGALAEGSVDLIVTSPPYAGAQKYIRATSLSIGWLGLAGAHELRALERKTIGREHFNASERQKPVSGTVPWAERLLSRIEQKNSLRAHLARVYLSEMQQAVEQMNRVMRRGGHLVLVVGNNVVAGYRFPTSRLLKHLCLEEGLTLRLELVDVIKSRGLMTKRNRTASLIAREQVFVFQKQ
jgi:Predicted DNA modification methylase